MGIIGRTIVAAITGAAFVTAAYATFAALGTSEGVNDRLRKAERIVGQYTGRPVSIEVHNKDFRLRDYVVRDNDPTQITLITEFRGNPYEKTSTPRPVKFNISDTPENIAAMRKSFYELLQPKNGIEANVWCKINPPTHKEISDGKGIFENPYNNELQWFTQDTSRIKCDTLGKKEIDVGNRHDTRPIKF